MGRGQNIDCGLWRSIEIKCRTGSSSFKFAELPFGWNHSLSCKACLRDEAAEPKIMYVICLNKSKTPTKIFQWGTRDQGCLFITQAQEQLRPIFCLKGWGNMPVCVIMPARNTLLFMLNIISTNGNVPAKPV